MPRMPAWLGDTMEKIFNAMMIPVCVKETENITEGLKKISFEGDFSKVRFTPGNVIEFRVSPTEMRHYTIAGLNKQNNTCEVLFYLHGLGEGSKWADGLQPGMPLKLMGPGGRIKYDYSRSRHFVFGDETSLGLFASMQQEASKERHALYVLAELDQQHIQWPALVGVQADTVAISHQLPAEAAVKKIQEMKTLLREPVHLMTFYLTGRAKSIQAVRKALVAGGVSMKNIQTEPYWSEGKKGL